MQVGFLGRGINSCSFRVQALSSFLTVTSAPDRLCDTNEAHVAATRWGTKLARSAGVRAP